MSFLAPSLFRTRGDQCEERFMCKITKVIGEIVPY